MQQRHHNRLQYFQEQSNTSRDFYVSYVSRFISVTADTKVLELGCGDGGNLLPFASLGCSVRTLQTSYRAVYGTTVQADIVALRVERAKALLADTRLPVGDIPAKLGFASPMHFARLFKAHTGMSMREWRHPGRPQKRRRSW